MMPPSITINRKLKKVTIEIALETARPSKATGRTMLIASTRGLRTSTETYARRPVLFTANVFFYPANPVDSGEGGEDSTGASNDPLQLKSRKHPQSVKVTKTPREEKL
jgi:hypothetical protein